MSQLTKIEPQQAIEKRIEFEPFDVRMLLEKAVDSKAAVEVVKELRAMQREDQDRRAKFDFDAALSKFQSECPTIIKTKSVENSYKYAPIEEVEQAIRPIERANGFTHVFNQDVESQPGWVIVKCVIAHVGGHTRETISKFPLGTKTRLMSDTQQYAAALTFGNRRTLANAYGLVIAGEDRDGQGNQKKSVSGKVATQATLVWFIEQTKDIHQKLLAYGIDKAIIMPTDSLDQWPLDQTPTSKAELSALRKEVEAHV